MADVNPKVLESLNYGIKSEIKTYVFYLEAAKTVDDAEMKETILRLAREEKEHYQILEKQHHSLITSEQWVTYNDILYKDGLPEINEDMADNHRELIDEVKNASGLDDILKIALRLEEEARDIFTDAAGRADIAEQKQIFEKLARFEQGHVNLIQGMMDSL